jgi:cytochrome c biogenesis protein CcmG/thiol:disulfide interchange protein DsbE
MWKFLLPGAAFVLLVVLFVAGLSPTRDIHALPSPLIGKPAPDFKLNDVLDPSRVVDNASLKGQVYVLNVWGSYCLPCRQEHPTLLAIAKQNIVPIIGLDYMDDRGRAKRWLEQFGNPYASVPFDTEGRVAIDWGVYGAPETYLVDAQGRIIFKYITPITQEVWNREFMPRITQARARAAG